jgi:hypothetical protein
LWYFWFSTIFHSSFKSSRFNRSNFLQGFRRRRLAAWDGKCDFSWITGHAQRQQAVGRRAQLLSRARFPNPLASLSSVPICHQWSKSIFLSETNPIFNPIITQPSPASTFAPRATTRQPSQNLKTPKYQRINRAIAQRRRITRSNLYFNQ